MLGAAQKLSIFSRDTIRLPSPERFATICRIPVRRLYIYIVKAGQPDRPKTVTEVGSLYRRLQA